MRVTKGPVHEFEIRFNEENLKKVRELSLQITGRKHGVSWVVNKAIEFCMNREDFVEFLKEEFRKNPRVGSGRWGKREKKKEEKEVKKTEKEPIVVEVWGQKLLLRPV
jgi:negative regulator of genetic competence, sporulation and motility